MDKTGRSRASGRAAPASRRAPRKLASTLSRLAYPLIALLALVAAMSGNG
jgi:hypothetical protein